MQYDLSNSADIIDIRDIIARVEELREQRMPRFVAGWNMPGYMPDSEPAEFDNADDAREYIADELDDVADQEELQDHGDDCAMRLHSAAECTCGKADRVDALCGAAAELRASDDDEFGMTVGDYHYWITQDGTTGLDDEEREELETLESLLSELQGYGGDEQWEGNWYPLLLIRESHFTEYARELADEIGAIPDDAGWPCNCIDWEQAARELKTDYSTIEYGDITYYYR